MSDVAILGAGVGPFGRYFDSSLTELAKPVIKQVLDESGISPRDVDMAFVANVVGPMLVGQVSVIGQTILARCEIEGIPVFNIDNACAASSSALMLATHAIAAGRANRVLVVGAEKMYHPNRAVVYRALNAAADIEWVRSTGINTDEESVFVTQVYPERIARYRRKYTLDQETLARIAVKNRSHAVNNPTAQFRDPLTVDDVLKARIVVPPLTSLMCAPPGDGVSAAVVVASDVARQSHREPIWLRGIASSMGSSARDTVGKVARSALAMANLAPEELDVCEVHDSTAFSELTAYEAIGLCPPGSGSELVAEGATSLGGSIPVNTSGGLESRGHPLAATGLAQLSELVLQLRGEAGDRQVPNARYALAENAGGYVNGDSAAVTITVLGRD